MSTITNSPEKKLKATINQENVLQEAVDAIRQYLLVAYETEEVEQHNSTMWAVTHMLCPWQRHSEAEDMGYLIGKIIAFLFHPERLTAFFQTTGFKPEDVIGSLTRMKTFFEKMSTDVEEAELTLFSILNRTNYYDADALETQRKFYNKLIAVQEARNEAFRI